MPVERCFDWESLDTRSSSPSATSTRPTATRAGRRTTRRSCRCSSRQRSPDARGRRSCSPAASRSRQLASRTTRPRPPARSERTLQAAFSRGLEGRALAAAGERLEAVAALREAEQELDACGSVRVRDEMRRELRRLGARAEPRGPAAPGDSGIDALSKRELEIAGLVTDRLTNREIAAALFLSDKTIESHLRNIFHKLGVSSRVEVARAVERERAGSAGAQA